MRISKNKLYVLLLFVLCFFASSFDRNFSRFIPIHPLSAYTDHPLVINIDGNQDFVDQAGSNGWSGDGSETTPFSITGLNITNSSLLPLISIQNTDVCFNITSNYLSGGSYGILLYNVTNCLILDNSVTDAVNSGLDISQSESLLIDRNEIYENAIHGIYLNYVNHTHIFNATLRNNGEAGLVADSTIDIEIEECKIHSNGQDGIKIREGHHNRILENYIYNNGPSFCGIIFGNAHHNIVSENLIFDNSKGIENGASHYNNFTNNAIYNNTGIGLFVLDHSIIKNNTFYNNGWWGVRAIGTNTTVMNNNFIKNNYHPTEPDLYSQATDDGTNSFTHNYYDHWIIPDENFDGIVDNYYPYGGGISLDDYPLTTAIVNPLLHLLTFPKICYPSSELYIRGTANITWGPASDTDGHEVSYSVSYSIDNGSSWILIQNEIHTTHFLWDTFGITTNHYTLLMINASCSDGLTSFDVSGGSFAIANNEHTLSTPNFITPLVGEHVSGNLQVEWEEAIDSWFLPITYELYFLNYQNEWELIDDNIGSTFFVWDTTPHEEGEMTLMVVAKNFEDGRVNATSGVFIIYNKPDPKKIPGYSIGILIGTLFISFFALVLILRKK